MARSPTPERRRRGDLIAAAAIPAVLLIGVITVAGTSAIAGTTARTATQALPPPPAATAVPVVLDEVWTAPSGATVTPVVAGGAVVTADGTRVIGHNAVTGVEHWSYERDRPLCAVGAGFPNLDGGRGRVLALYEGGAGYCSELTALRPGTGARAAASNPDVRPGTRLIASGSSVLATGAEYLEVLRSDLVRTLEYGKVPAPTQPDHQPRPDCTRGSIAVGADRVGLVERCPGEPADRLTVVAANGKDGAEEPQEEFSVPLPGTGAVIVAVSTDHTAVAMPGRLIRYDRAGKEVAQHPLDVPDREIADPPGWSVAAETTENHVLWWTGSRLVALDAGDLTPRWTTSGALGPAIGYADRLLAPVPAGIAVLDPADGAVESTIPVSRSSLDPVRLAAAGAILLEQRGPEIVAFRPR